MGIIRLLLAIAVLVDHAGAVYGFRLISGAMAVEAFFIISGFYMALVLNEKYMDSKGSYSLFLSNRMLRLFPIYWVVLLLTILISSLFLFFLNEPMKWSSYMSYHHLMPETWCLLIFANIFILGQDVVMFLGLKTSDGSLFFTPDFLKTSPGLYTYLFVHQAWSLSLEIMFYVIAPFLCRRNLYFLAIIGAGSLGVRVYTHSIGLINDPWTYRFFPSELIFFIAGIFCYKAYACLNKYQISGKLLRLSFGVVISFTLVYQFLPARIITQVAYYVVFTVALPFIFMLTKKNKLDYRIGELSYPVYISHLLILFILYAVSKFYPVSQSFLSFSLILTTIIFSTVLIRFVAEPIEKIRQRRVVEKSADLPVSAGDA